MDQSFLLLSMSKPWEVEELACVHDYIVGRHMQLLDACKIELQKLHPKKDLDSGIAFLLNNTRLEADYLNRLSTTGLHNILHVARPRIPPVCHQRTL